MAGHFSPSSIFFNSKSSFTFMAKRTNIFKKMTPVRTANYTRADRTAMGHEIKVQYIASITI